MFRSLTPSLLFSASFVVVVASATGCPAPVCSPGASVSCACPNGDEGAQVCRENATGFDACVCSGGPAPETDAGALDDAGIVEDAGVVDDAGIVEDAGGRPDAGLVQTDAGRDAGGVGDGGTGDGGVVDAGEGGVVDAGEGGVVDAGEGPVCSPRSPGELGGTCVVGACTDGVASCFEEFLPLTGPASLGALFGIPSGIVDTENPGEFIAGAPSTIPIRVNPNDQCSAACTFVGNECGECASCSNQIGPQGFSTVGLSVSSFYAEVNNGICRTNCEYDATLATNGGCGDDFTCSKTEGVCVEACVSDDQCNLRFGQSRTDGLVATIGVGWGCDVVSGQCTHAENGAVQGDSCEEDLDCPQSGVCLAGRCATVACETADGSPGAVPCDGVCISAGSGTGTLCLESCQTGDDCPATQACSLFDDVGICVGGCDEFSTCAQTERCRSGIGQEANTIVPRGFCRAICDANLINAIGVPDAIECGAAQTCVSANGQEFGFCENKNEICQDSFLCVGGQACEVLGNDLFGRCVDGCENNSECNAANLEECVQNESPPGICRRPGGTCALSPETGAGPLQPLLGDAQCVSTQTCSSAGPRELGTCVD